MFLGILGWWEIVDDVELADNFSVFIAIAPTFSKTTELKFFFISLSLLSPKKKRTTEPHQKETLSIKALGYQ